jgi:hypothetical protein
VGQLPLREFATRPNPWCIPRVHFAAHLGAQKVRSLQSAIKTRFIQDQFSWNLRLTAHLNDSQERSGVSRMCGRSLGPRNVSAAAPGEFPGRSHAEPEKGTRASQRHSPTPGGGPGLLVVPAAKRQEACRKRFDLARMPPCELGAFTTQNATRTSSRSPATSADVCSTSTDRRESSWAFSIHNWLGRRGAASAFVVMPNHVHSLVWFPVDNQTTEFLKQWKKRSSVQIKRLALCQPAA